MSINGKHIQLTLDQLKAGESALIMGFDDLVESRILELGLTLGTNVELAHIAPFGGSVAVRCRGTLIAMRQDIARQIFVQPLSLVKES